MPSLRTAVYVVICSIWSDDSVQSVLLKVTVQISEVEYRGSSVCSVSVGAPQANLRRPLQPLRRSISAMKPPRFVLDHFSVLTKYDRYQPRNGLTNALLLSESV